MRVLACPASLKGVLTAAEAAAALGRGARRVAGIEVVESPVADGGEGTLEVLALARRGRWRSVDVHDAFGRPRRARWLELADDRAIVEAAEAIPLDPRRLDPFAASSRGLGEVVAAVGRRAPRELVVCLGGTANVDGGLGFREVVRELPAQTRVACDVRSPLVDAARVRVAEGCVVGGGRGGRSRRGCSRSRKRGGARRRASAASSSAGASRRLWRAPKRWS
jgi:glycerate kinase